jgi:hypothetical protein
MNKINPEKSFFIMIWIILVNEYFEQLTFSSLLNVAG